MNVVLNVQFASVFGIIAGIIFTFSGNFWPVVLLHSLYDFLFFITEDLDSPDWPVYVEVGIFIVIMVFYLVALYRKRNILAAFWDTRWNNTKQ